MFECKQLIKTKSLCVFIVFIALQQTDTARTKPLSSAELGQPVPLEVLIKHKILEAKLRSLTCTIMVSQYYLSR